MKYLFGLCAGLGVAGVFIALVLGLVITVCGVIGVVVTFPVSILIGIIFLILPVPMFTITGILWVFAGYNLPQVLQTLFNLPF